MRESRFCRCGQLVFVVGPGGFAKARAAGFEFQQVRAATAADLRGELAAELLDDGEDPRFGLACSETPSGDSEERISAFGEWIWCFSVGGPESTLPPAPALDPDAAALAASREAETAKELGAELAERMIELDELEPIAPPHPDELEEFDEHESDP
jgi:hypothetical protein